MSRAVLIASVFLLSACTLKPSSGQVHLTIELPRTSRAALELAPDWLKPRLASLTPADLSSMDCFFLNVNGPGIEPDTAPSSQELSFLELGVSSGIADRTDGAVSMRVPAGVARTIQVLGLAASPSLLGQCAGIAPADFLIANRPSLFEVGRTTTALYQDQTVNVANAYDPRFAFDLMSQYEGTLALNQGYFGQSPLGGINTLGGGLPPAGMTELEQTGLAAAFAKLQNPALTAGLVYALTPPGAGNQFARLDFAFSLGSIDLSKYRTFKIDGRVGGGASAFAGGVCGAPAANNRVDVAVYDSLVAGWTTTTSAMTTSPAALPTLELPLLTELIDQSGGQNFIHVAMLSTDAATGATCSNILVDELRLTLVP
jgi:hypothetical protein